MKNHSKQIAEPEQKLYERFPDIAEAIIIQSVDADFGPNDDGTPMKGKALPLGWVVEWLDIVKKQALQTAERRGERRIAKVIAELPYVIEPATCVNKDVSRASENPDMAVGTLHISYAKYQKILASLKPTSEKEIV